MPRYDDWYDFPASKPIAVRGGIKARSSRGAFATQWWGQRWLSVLESLNLGGRLARAKSYARKGQILDLTIDEGRVTAAVQGSRPEPYRVVIGLKTIGEKGEQRIAAALAKDTRCLAKLAAREMPPEIESVFSEAGVALFPSRASELKTSCSCPDWSNPCKHIAAVYYLLGEEFDRDPFLIFRLRGLDLDELTRSAPIVGESEPIVAPVEQSSDNFWESDRAEVDLTIDDKQKPAPLLRLLGNLPFWRGEHPLVDLLEESYRRGANAAKTLLARE